MEEFGSFKIPSNCNQIHTMKAGVLRLLEFIVSFVYLLYVF